MIEEPFIFKNRKEKRLFGIAHVPGVDSQIKIGLIMLPAGVVYRVGPHRLYVEMARYLCQYGFYIFRIDTSGIGDSENENELGPEKLVDHYLSIQNGKYIEDTVDAIQFLKQKYQLQKTILSGLCGGAITALLTAGMYPDLIDGLILIGLPVLYECVDGSKNNINDDFAKFAVKGYASKILDFNSWRRFLEGQTDYNLLWHSFTGVFKSFILRKNDNDHPLLNYNVINAFTNYISYNKNIYFIFGQNDKYHWEFDKEIKNRYLKKNGASANNYEILLIENANHSFSKKEWKQKIFENCRNWLDKNHYYKEKEL